MVFSAWWAARILESPWERRLHLRRAAPRGGLARGGWRSAVALDVGVLRNELASSSPCGDERAAGPTRFLSLERVLSSVVLAFLSPRSVIGIGRARCNSARRAAGFACVCFAMRRRACCGAYPRFYRSGAFCAFPASLHVALGLGGGWGLQRYRGPGRRSASALIAATPRRRAVGSSVRVGGRRRCARAPLAVFSLPLRVEVHIVASQCWKTVRVRPSVCSPARLGGSLVICCALRAVGRRFCVARGPSSCGGRGTSWWALRTGRLLFNIVGWSMLLTGNQAGIFPLFGAPLRSLCRPRGCGVRSRRGGQGSAALCGRL